MLHVWQTLSPRVEANRKAGECYGLASRLNPPAFVLIPATGAEWSTAILLGVAWDDFWKRSSAAMHSITLMAKPRVTA